MSVLSNPSRSGRLAAGSGLIGFSALLVVEDRLDPTSDLSFHEAATVHPGMLTASALVLLASALLTIPAAVGVIHQARDRGAVLARVGALFAILGALGHTALAVLYLVLRSLAGGDVAEMAAFEERIDNDVATGLVAMTLLLSFGVGLMLLAWAAWRAGLIRWWGPTAVTVVVIAHALLPGDVPTAVGLVGLSVLAGVFGALGVRALRMSDAAWGGEAAAGRRSLPTAAPVASTS